MPDDFTPIAQGMPPKKPGVLATLAKAAWEPVGNYLGMVGTGAQLAGKVILDPTYRQITQKVNAGQELTEVEAAKILANPTPRFMGREMMNMNELNKFRDLKSGLWEGTKRTAGMEAYLAPALIAPIAGGGMAYAGGQGALRALGAGAGSGVAQKAAVGAARGLLGGGLLGYAGTQENDVGKAIANTAVGGIVGAGVGGAMGAVSGAAEKPIMRAKIAANQYLESKMGQPPSDWARGLFAKLFQVSKNKGTRDIDTDYIASHWMEDRMPIPKNMRNINEISREVNKNLGAAVNQAAQAYDDQRIPYTSIYDAARGEMQNKIGFDKPVQDELIRTLQTMDMQAKSNANVIGAVQKLGLPQETAEQAIEILNKVDPINYMGPPDQGTGQVMPDPRLAYQAAVRALSDNGFDPDVAQNIAITALEEAKKPANVATVTPLQAIEMKRTIGKNLGSWKRAWLGNKDPKAEVYYRAYSAAYRELAGLIDDFTADLPANNVLLYVPDESGQNTFQKLAKLSPKFAQKIADNPTLGNWTSSMAPYVQAGQAANETINQQSRILDQVISRGQMGLGGALAGYALGGLTGGASALPVIAGAIFGPIIQPFTAQLGESIRVPLTAAAATGIHGVASGAVPAALMSTGANIMNTLASKATTAPIITGATSLFLNKNKAAQEIRQNAQPTINQEDDFTPLQ